MKSRITTLILSTGIILLLTAALWRAAAAASPPVANDDSELTLINTPLTVYAPGVLANDSDADGDPLAASLLTAPVNGTVSLATDGGYIYTPTGGFVGTDLFTYTVSDGGASDTAGVSIKVLLSGNQDVDVTLEAAGWNLFSYPLQISQTVSQALVSISGFYTTVYGYDAADTSDPWKVFDVTVPSPFDTLVNDLQYLRSGSGYWINAVEPVTITFSYAGRAAATTMIGGVRASEPPPATLYGYLFGSSAAGGSGITVYVDNNQCGSGRTVDLGGGVLIYVADVATASADFPSCGQAGRQLTFVIDGTQLWTDAAWPGSGAAWVDLQAAVPTAVALQASAVTATAVVLLLATATALAIATLLLARSSWWTRSLLSVLVLLLIVTFGWYSVQQLEGAPRLPPSPPHTIYGDVTLAGGGAAPDGTKVIATVTNSPTRTLSVTTTVFTSGSSGLYSVNIPGDDAFTTPYEGGIGGDAVSFRLESGAPLVPGATFNSGASTELNLVEQNVAPIAANDSYTTTEDTTLSVAAPGVISNDVDINDDTLAAKVVGNVASGALALSADGSLIYTPTADYSGVVTFTYVATDGMDLSNTVTVTITVNPVNDPPVATDGAYAVDEDTTLTGGNVITQDTGFGVDSDIDGDPLTASLVSDVATGTLALNGDGTFSYTPPLNYNSAVTFTYRLTDTSTAPAGNFVNSGNDFDGGDYMGALGDVDGDGDIDVVTAAAGAFRDSVLYLNDGNGVFIDSGQTLGSNSRTVVMADFDGDGDLDVFLGRYNDSNLVWLNDGSGLFTDSGQTLSSYRTWGLVAGDIDGDGDLDVIGGDQDALRIWTNDGTATFSTQAIGGGYLMVSLGDVDGDTDLDLVTATYSDPIQVWTNDGSGVFTNSGQSLGTGNHGASGEIVLGDLDGDGDFDFYVASELGNNEMFFNDSGGVFTASAQSFPTTTSGGAVLVDVDGDGDIDLYAAHTGSNADVLYLNDGAGVFTDSGRSLRTVTTDWVAMIDVDGDGWRDAVLLGNSNQVWTEQGDWAYSNTAVVTITVNPINDAPAAVDNSYSVAEDSVLTGGNVISDDTGEGVDSDIENDPLTAVLVDDVATGALALNGDGSFSYTPTLDFNGVVTFSYQLSDYSTLPTDQFADSGVTFGGGGSAYGSVGDVDGDGDIDIVASANFGATTKVWVNDGVGGFTDSGQNLGSPITNIMGDFDGDGDLDVFTGIYNDPNHVWLNDGSGNFADSGQLLNSYRTYDLVVGDVDGDSDLDVIGGDQDAIRVWVNDGDATFTTQVIPGSGNRYIVGLGDLDGDGDLDFATAPYTGPLEVWTNNGSGTFTNSGQSLGAGNVGQFGQIVVGDLDGDGDLDLFAASEGGADELFFNDGSGVFTPSVQTFPAIGSGSAVMSDIDSDGDLDVYVGHTPGQDVLYFNNGSGALIDSGYVLRSGDTDWLAIADVTGDGVRDALLFGDTNSLWTGQAISALSNAATVTITVTPVNDVPTATNGAYSVAEDTTLTGGNVITEDTGFGVDIDIDGDALTASLVDDVAVGTLSLNGDGGFSYTPPLNYNGTVTFTYWLTDGGTIPAGTGSFAAGQDFNGSQAFGLAVGDLDGDGDQDVVQGVNGVERAWLNQGGAQGGTAGTFGDLASFGDSESVDAELGDLDGDGDLDLVLSNYTGTRGQAYLNDGAGGFTLHDSFGSGIFGRGVELADLDGDGDLDSIHARYPSGSDAEIWLNQGGAQAGTPGVFSGGLSQTLSVGPGGPSVAAGDLDGDGDPDFVMSTASVSYAWLNQGGAQAGTPGTFNATADSSFGSGSQNVVLGDMDSDGDLDAVLSRNTGGSEVWLNDGSGGFGGAAHHIFSAGQNADLGDLDGDGDLDVVVGFGNSTLKSHFNNGDGTLGTVVQAFGDLQSVLKIADLDGDGVLDVLNARNVLGQSTVWLGHTNDLPVFSNTAVVTITVIPVNDAPTAAADFDITFYNTPITGGPPGLLGNDSDIDGDALSTSLGIAPASGTATVNADGSYTYTPSLSTIGTVTFTYVVSDGGLTDTATVTVLVLVDPNAPIDVVVDTPGWNIVGYPLQVSQPVADALISVSGFYTAVFGYDSTDTADPWKMVNVTIPPPFDAFLNDLITLDPGKAYWIEVTQPVTIIFDPGRSAGTRALTMASGRSTLSDPPMTVYGTLDAGWGVPAVAGLPVVAWINGAACGSGVTHLAESGAILIGLHVNAADASNPDCGTPGAEISLTVDETPLPVAFVWDNRGAVDLATVTGDPTAVQQTSVSINGAVRPLGLAIVMAIALLLMTVKASRMGRRRMR